MCPCPRTRPVARQRRDFPDFPNGGAMGLPIAEQARADGSRVLLNGLGGDQWLCGSDAVYAEAIAGRRGRELLSILRDDIHAAGLRTTLWRLLRHGIVPLLPEPAQQNLRAFAQGCGGLPRRLTRLTGSRSPCRPGFSSPAGPPAHVSQRGSAPGAVASTGLPVRRLPDAGDRDGRTSVCASRPGNAPAVLERQNGRVRVGHARAVAPAGAGGQMAAPARHARPVARGCVASHQQGGVFRHVFEVSD